MHTQCHKGRWSFRSWRGFCWGLHTGIKRTCYIVMGQSVAGQLIGEKSYCHECMLVVVVVGWGRVVVCEKHICFPCILWVLKMQLHCEASCWGDDNCNLAIFYPGKFKLTSFYCNVLLLANGAKNLWAFLNSCTWCVVMSLVATPVITLLLLIIRHGLVSKLNGCKDFNSFVQLCACLFSSLCPLSRLFISAWFVSVTLKKQYYQR